VRGLLALEEGDTATMWKTLTMGDPHAFNFEDRVIELN
jgi:hypothetical protein